ncbi:ABC transporter ATP-binding protein/permease [Horticoccus luteus]|uniref:ABC transporter ATP-binding protein/permease n=1 Tax=Horticoccus luteus TaxID=2862869 RepID=A0A8F9TU54_9BACT|nr:ABC transporter ATP-binding protein [Horticoccus luteus]QYM77839.1 ABC transporter ATP-binding protein/permease [Horticoccus luteus]
MRRLFPYLRFLRLVRGPIVKAIVYGIIYGAASGAGIPLLVKYVFPPIFQLHGALELSTVVLIAACIPTVFLLRAVAGYLNSYYTQYAGVRILEALRGEYFEKLQRLPLSFVQSRQTGDLLSRGLADTQQLQFALTLVANDGIKQPATLLGSLVALAVLALTSQGVLLLLVCFAVVPLVIFPIRYVGRKVIKRAAQMQAELGSVTGHFSENLSAAREVRAFSLEDREVARFGTHTHALVVAQMKIAKYAQALTPAIEVISAAGIAGTLVYAYQSGIDLATFIALIGALYTSYEPIKKLGSLNNEIKRATAALDRLEVVLHEPVTIADPADPVPVTRLRGDIAFNHVSFAYTTDAPVLRDISTSIPAGAVCALVGPSGAGKSTFANLVPRFYEVGAGAVTIDALDVRALRLADLRRNIALVSQEPVLFNDTIAANILLGRPDATRAEIETAARDAFAHDFILAQPLGYETIVGERGAALSGGQRQRIALARAFLRNAPILVLDEPTSALDSESEAAVQLALKKLMQGKTVLIIAHRFSTIRDATQILVFDRGVIAATGTHAELYAANPLYRSLYDHQSNTALPPAAL